METAIRNSTTKRTTGVQKKLAIVTCCVDEWGGSEELWWKAALLLKEQDLEILVLKLRINPSHPKFRELSKNGIFLKELDTFSQRSTPQRLFIKAWKKIRRADLNHCKSNFENQLKEFCPDHVLIAQGINFDGLMYAGVCMALNLPYSIISQKAVEFYWPPQSDRDAMVGIFRGAQKCFFVSRHNLQLTEEQFGIRFTNAEIVWNPLKLQRKIIPYPSTQNGWKLACVGRLFIIDKGQDILLRILAQQKWRERPLTVSFIGDGVDEKGLREMAALLQLTQVEFSNYVDDIEEVWKTHHALVLPSRSEGLPLVILEAMAAGRVVITTRAGGNAEVVEEDKTGFIEEATISSFDRALEKAWQKRNDWEAMGRNAFSYACENIPEAPETDFANTLTKLIYEL